MGSVLEKVAKAISRNYGITLEFKGSQAYTDGKKIVIPALPETMDAEAEVTVRGYCDHEIGHVLYSDFDILKEMKGDPRLKTLTNLLEDIRIERRLGQDYIGVKVNIEATMTKLANMTKLAKGIDESLLSRLWLEGRRQVCGYPFKGHDSWADDLKAKFGVDLFKKIGALSSSRDAMKLASEMLRIFDKAKEEMEAPSADGTGGEGAEGESGESKSGKSKSKGKPDGKAKSKSRSKKDKGDGVENIDPFGEAKKDGVASEKKEDKGGSDGAEHEEGDEGEGADGDGTEAWEGEGDIEAGEGGESVGAGESADGGMSTGSDDSADDEDDDLKDGGDSKPGSPNKTTEKRSAFGAEDKMDDWKDVMDGLKEGLEEVTRAAFAYRQYVVYDKSKDVVKPIPEDSDTRIFDDLKSSLGPLNMIKAKVGNMFLAKTASRWLCDREEGRINGKALARVKTGARTVFKEKWTSQERDTAITFLVDFSGSMRGRRIYNAMRAVVLFLETLKTTGIKCEALGYTTDQDVVPPSHEDKFKGYYGRVENLVTYVIKAFDESYGAKIKRRISGYHDVYFSENCDGDSVKLAYDRLIKRREKRKILFVLTDGIVANRGNVNIGKQYLKDINRAIEKEGKVELIGVGIGVRGMNEYYTKHIELDGSGATLAADLFAQLKKIFKVNVAK